MYSEERQWDKVTKRWRKRSEKEKEKERKEKDRYVARDIVGQE